jgi:drug/metabolite transporter (DMT)-like permease
MPCTPARRRSFWAPIAGTVTACHTHVMGEIAAAQRQSTRGLFLLAVVVLAWGTMWPVNKALLAYMTPIWSIALRSCISVVALFWISLFATGLTLPKREDAPVLISMVLLHMVGFTILSQLALQIVPAGRSTVLAYTCVLWAPLGAAAFLGERISARRAVGLALGVLGLIVIFNPAAFDWSDSGAIAGNAALLLAAMLWAASIVHNRGHRWHSSPFQLAPWQALLAAAILVFAAFLFEGPPAVDWNFYSISMIAFAGIPGTALAYWAAAVSSSELPASTTSIGLLATPAVSIVVSMLMLGEQPTVSLIVALALILSGMCVGIVGTAAPELRR